MFEGLMMGELVRKRLETAAEHPASIILSGRRGSGMAHCALELAKAWLGTGDPDCHPDFVRVDDSERTVPKETVLGLTGAAEPYPVAAGHRVFLVDDAERLGAEGQNALLKTLEDLTHNVFIFVCHGSLLPTVESRCMRVDFSPMGRGAFGDRVDDAAYYGSCGTPGAYKEISGDGEFLAFLRRVPEALLTRRGLYTLMGVASEASFREGQFFVTATGRQLGYFWNFLVSGINLALCGTLGGRSVPDVYAPLLGIPARRLLAMKETAEDHRRRSAAPGYSRNDFYAFLHDVTREGVA